MLQAILNYTGDFGLRAAKEAKDDYFSYLIRIWRVAPVAGREERETAVWRASLHDPHTGEARHFADLESLFVFLRRQTGDRPSPLTD